MLELAQSIAARPFSLERSKKACQAIHDAFGVECLIEAVAVAAAFELNTKCADATGKAPFENWMLKLMYIMLSVVRWILAILRLQRHS